MFELGHRLGEVESMLEEMPCTSAEYSELVDAFCEASGQIREIPWRCPVCGGAHRAHTVVTYCAKCRQIMPTCSACRFGDCIECRCGSLHSERSLWWKGDDLAFDDFDLRCFKHILDRVVSGDFLSDDLCGGDDDGERRPARCVEFGCDHCIDVSVYPETALQCGGADDDI